MLIIKISEIGKNITNDIVGNQIYEKIKAGLNKDSVTLDFSDVNVMTTFCAKQIFRPLLEELGEEEFNKRILFKNITPTIEYEINMGLNG